MTDNITTPEDEILLEKEKKFQEKLKMGIHAENVVYPYLKTNNSYVEDLRQQKHGEFAGPRMCGTEGTVTLPDFLVYNKNPAKGSYAVDVKSKTSVCAMSSRGSFLVNDKKSSVTSVKSFSCRNQITALGLYFSPLLT